MDICDTMSSLPSSPVSPKPSSVEKTEGITSVSTHSNEKPDTNSTNCTIYVGSIAPHVTEDDLTSFFSSKGYVLAQPSPSFIPKQSKKCGFVKLTSNTDAVRAIAQFNSAKGTPLTLPNIPLRVSFAERKNNNNSTNGGGGHHNHNAGSKNVEGNSDYRQTGFSKLNSHFPTQSPRNNVSRQSSTNSQPHQPYSPPMGYPMMMPQQPFSYGPLSGYPNGFGLGYPTLAGTGLSMNPTLQAPMSIVNPVSGEISEHQGHLSPSPPYPTTTNHGLLTPYGLSPNSMMNIPNVATMVSPQGTLFYAIPSQSPQLFPPMAGPLSPLSLGGAFPISPPPAPPLPATPSPPGDIENDSTTHPDTLCPPLPPKPSARKASSSSDNNLSSDVLKPVTSNTDSDDPKSKNTPPQPPVPFSVNSRSVSNPDNSPRTSITSNRSSNSAGISHAYGQNRTGPPHGIGSPLPPQGYYYTSQVPNVVYVPCAPHAGSIPSPHSLEIKPHAPALPTSAGRNISTGSGSVQVSTMSFSSSPLKNSS